MAAFQRHLTHLQDGDVHELHGKRFANNTVAKFGNGNPSTGMNAALPGKHYDVPLPKEVKVCFEEWQRADDDTEKKKVFIDFMRKKVNLSQLDDSTLITGLVTPPAAMAAKRAGESVPQLKLIKAIPDVIFVPSATMLALVTVKLSRKMVLG
ncbi:Calcium-binding EF hand family protein [Abeliophyllum distichum]|uniref:Calcium-binding EF hand family protein n=1 Tax=Abeliophyllum distichum TaxID=126358 RepID=A0ABD1PAH9_9LAMI